MTRLFDCHFEINLDELDSVNDADIFWSADAALVSTSGGMATLIDDTDDIWGQFSFTISTSATDVRFRFHFDPNTITIPNYNSFILLYIRADDLPLRYLFQFGLYFDDTNFQMRALCIDDTGTARYTDYYTITDAEHCIEAHLKRAATSSSKDGELHFLVDQVLKESVIDVDTYVVWGREAFTLYAGAPDSVDTGTSGTVYYDEFAFSDDADEIGPYTPPADDIVVLRRRIE